MDEHDVRAKLELAALEQRTRLIRQAMFSRSKTWKLVSFVLTVGLIYFATMYLYDKPVIGHLYPAFIVLVVLQG